MSRLFGSAGDRLRTSGRLVVDTVTRFQSNRCPLMAAGLAYYLLISTSPVLVVAIGVAGIFLGRDQVEHGFFDRIATVIGPETADSMQRLVHDPRLFSGGVAATLIAVVVLLYGSTRAFAALESAFNVIWETPPSDTIRSSAWLVIRSRLVAMVMVLATGLVILISMALETLGSAVEVTLMSHAPDWIPFSLGSRLGAIPLRAACLAGIYYLLPVPRPQWRAVWPSALLVAVVLSLGHTLIAWYVEYGGVRSAYGAAGSVIALLFSFYYVAYVVLFGAQLTQVVAARRG